MDVFLSRVRGAVAEDRWIVDGNYSAIRDLVWQRADMVIWLDYSLTQIMWRICKRTVWRALTRQELWNGNREPVARFFSRDSIILWALNTYQRRRSEYPALMARPEYAHIRFLRFTSSKAASDWLETIARPTHESHR
jgi:adenylate kinase family enzyme